MKKVFISYRRDDSAHAADRIYEALIRALPKDHVFIDIEKLPPGTIYSEVLREWVANCDVLLALIGQRWLSAAEPETGKRRLDSPDDFVRLEIREALEQDKAVPVILDGTKMPEAHELPDDLKRLSRLQAQFIERRTFDTDTKRLISWIFSTQFGPQPQLGPEPEPLPVIPETVRIPDGHFSMGSPPAEAGRSADEGPLHTVLIPQAFEIGRYPVTRGQFAAFAQATQYRPRGGAYIWNGMEWGLNARASWQNPGFDQDNTHPVVCVNSEDIQAYIDWLNREAPGQSYRLPSEAEWEYACRAGTVTPFWWGSSISTVQANYNGNHTYGPTGAKSEYRQKTLPVYSFEPNPWGLYQVHGNVWERCADVWSENGYQLKPRNLIETGGAATLGDREYCVVRGGSWESNPGRLRAAYRTRASLRNRYSDRGFRLVKTL